MLDESRPSVGVVGLGKMGAPMGHRLLAAGHRVVVFNRSPARCAPLVAAGAVAAPSIADLAAGVDVVITCLDSVASSEAVYLAPGGVVAHARPGALLIEHSTVTPALVHQIAKAASRRGVHFVDAPVSGGPEGAEQGTLAIMVGGSASAADRARSVAAAYGRTIVHLGNVGAGTHAKLVNQLLTFVHGAAAAEAIAFAQSVGLDLAALGEVLRAGFGQSRMLERTMARVVGDDYSAGAALSLYAKDLGIVTDVARASDLTLPVVESARTWLAAALDAGLAARDIAALRLRYPPAGPRAS